MSTTGGAREHLPAINIHNQVGIAPEFILIRNLNSLRQRAGILSEIRPIDLSAGCRAPTRRPRGIPYVGDEIPDCQRNQQQN
jgi:hypothetical protein